MINEDLLLIGAVVAGAIVVLGFARTIFRVLLFQLIARLFTGPGLAVLLPALGLSGALLVGGDEAPEPQGLTSDLFSQGVDKASETASKATSSGMGKKIKDTSCDLVLEALDAMSEVSVISRPASSLHRKTYEVCHH